MTIASQHRPLVGTRVRVLLDFTSVETGGPLDPTSIVARSISPTAVSTPLVPVDDPAAVGRWYVEFTPGAAGRWVVDVEGVGAVQAANYVVIDVGARPA